MKTDATPIMVAVSLSNAPAYPPEPKDFFICKAPPREEDLYCFVPEPDDFSLAELDLSFLNDKPARSHSFLKRVGDRLVFEDGTPARFWGTGEAFTPSHYSAELLAGRLTKYGINCVRFHSLKDLVDESRNDTHHLDTVKMDRFDYLVAKLKEQGIYVYFALMYPHSMVFKKGDGLPETFARKGGVEFFNSEELEIRFNAWLLKKYGIQEAPLKAWQMPGERSPLSPQEQLDMYSVRLLKTWDYGRLIPHYINRSRDQIRFYYELESKFYSKTCELLRSWGLKCPIITSNWKGTRFTQYAYPSQPSSEMSKITTATTPQVTPGVLSTHSR